MKCSHFGTIDSFIHNHDLTFKFTKFWASNNIDLLACKSSEKGIANVTSNAFEILYLSKDETKAYHFGGNNRCKAIFT